MCDAQAIGLTDTLENQVRHFLELYLFHYSHYPAFPWMPYNALFRPRKKVILHSITNYSLSLPVICDLLGFSLRAEACKDLLSPCHRTQKANVSSSLRRL